MARAAGECRFRLTLAQLATIVSSVPEREPLNQKVKRLVSLNRPIPRGAYEVLAPIEIAGGDRFALEHVCRAQVQPVYLGDHTAVCRILGRYKFFVDTRDHGFGVNLLLDGFWEMWLTMVMTRILKPGMTVVDIGANFGYYAVLFGDMIGPSGRLIAVEPNPAARTLLERSLGLNGLLARTTVVAAAASSTDVGSALFYVPTNEPKNALVLADRSHANLELGTLSEVPLWCLDKAVDSKQRIDLIKIDAEGAEEAILEGMRLTLQRHKPILVLEYNPLRYTDPGALLDLLISIYGFFHAITFEGTLQPISKAEVMADHGGEDWLLYFSVDPKPAMQGQSEIKLRSLR
ncbi:FkbM family methyltransferase [Lichenihabitans psoromatis]|uniref:FkbM family methyltransferase n=1 Tax=Lichenihabitans psoromatis TaxID=2528642 RepID=UPI0010384BF6|nr:FkbM family methyltransferase [Lichenihabitans psoromatis]